MSETVTLEPAVPVLRIYDLAKAMEFYVDFLGFRLDWEHRYAPDLPVYAQVSRSGVKLHLSQHYGDGTPGAVVYIRVDDAPALLGELHAKQASFARPAPNALQADITDPFGNVLRFDGSRR